MTLILSVQALQPSLPQPDVEFSQQKDRSQTYGVGPFADFERLASWVASDRVMVLLEIMGKVHPLGFDLGQLNSA